MALMLASWRHSTTVRTRGEGLQRMFCCDVSTQSQADDQCTSPSKLLSIAGILETETLKCS